MSIRIGANPIGWINDDLQEIGGDTPLETCLAEAKEAGVVGMEKGHKLPSDGAALTSRPSYRSLAKATGPITTAIPSFGRSISSTPHKDLTSSTGPGRRLTITTSLKLISWSMTSMNSHIRMASAIGMDRRAQT